MKQEVQNGLAHIPSFQGAGYTVNGNNYIAYIMLDNERHDVGFNVLEPESLLEGVGDVISESLIK